MALVPRMLRPSAMIRRKAMYSGFLGNSGFWKFVGVVVYGKSTLKKFFGKAPEVIELSKLGPGRSMQITTIKPQTRRRRRRMAARGVVPSTLTDDRAAALSWAQRAAAGAADR